MVIGTGVGALAPYALFALDPKSKSDPGLEQASTYPPTLTGMRGSHELAWEGKKPERYAAQEEHYDLVVVGAGMSGLAAAWFYRKKMGHQARVLILDNHDDFGGHAKRNECIDEAAIEAMDKNTPDNYLLGGKLHGSAGMTMPTADGHVTVGGHWYKFMHGRGEYAAAVRGLPLPEEEQDKLIAFFGGELDVLDDLSLSESYDYINSVSYNRFLVDRVGLGKETRIYSFWTVGLAGTTRSWRRSAWVRPDCAPWAGSLTLLIRWPR